MSSVQTMWSVPLDPHLTSDAVTVVTYVDLVLLLPPREVSQAEKIYLSGCLLSDILILTTVRVREILDQYALTEKLATWTVDQIFIKVVTSD